MNEQLTQIYGYLHGMWRYRWSALVIAWLVALIGWPVVFSLPDQFSAKAVVYIDTTSALKPLLKGLAPETDSDDELRVMTRVLLSRENLMSVVRETDMDLEVDTAEEREDLVQQLAGAIQIEGGGGKKWEAKTNIYEISYQSRAANRAYQVVSNLLNTMIEDTLTSTRTDTITAQKFFDTQIDEYEERLSKAEQKLAEFKKENVGFMPDERGGYYMRLQRAQDEVKNTQSALRLEQRRYSELQKQLKGENPILGNSAYQSSKETKIRLYQERLDDLLNQFTDKHPDVLAVQGIIDDLKNNVGDEAGVQEGSGADDSSEFNPVYQEVKVELSKASVAVETLKSQLSEQTVYVEKLKSSIDIIPEVEARLAKLNRGYEVTRERYLDLVERRESAKLAQNAGQSSSDISFRVIEPPIVPSKPSGPNRILLLITVLLAAMGAGLGWSFMRYIFQPTFIDLNQLGRVTGIPVLGAVSLYMSPEHIKSRRIQLASFLTANILLVLVFGAVMWFRQSGVSIMGSFFTGI